MAYAYQLPLEVVASAVGGSNSTDFTHCLKIVGDNNLKIVALGGLVENLDGSFRPCDLVIATDLAGTSLIGGWEIGSYDGTLGNLTLYLKRSTDSISNDQLYLCVGDVAVTTYQGGSLGDAWDSNSVVVLPFRNGTTLDLSDSSGNGTTFTNVSLIASAGVHGDGAAHGNGSSRLAYVSGFSGISAAPVTIECYFYFDDVNSNRVLSTIGNLSSSQHRWQLDVDSGNVRWINAYNALAYAATKGGLSNGNWYHVAGVEVSSSSRYAYVDGVPGSQETSTNAANSINALGIFANTHNGIYGNGQHISGHMDFYRVSSVARSTAWLVGTSNNLHAPTAQESTSNAWWIAGAWTPIATGQTIDINQSSETDTALSITPRKRVAIGIASETDSALSISPKKRIAIGIAQELSSAFSIIARKKVSIGIASEVDTALAFSSKKTVPIGLASETNSAQIIRPLKRVAIGIANESDFALDFESLKAGTIGLAVETDSALSITPRKRVSIGLAVETDTAFGIVFVAGSNNPFFYQRYILARRR